jgi:hypothetical protein
MMHLLWILPLAAGVAAVWSGRLQGVALLVALICALIGLARLVMRQQPIAPSRAPHEPDTRDVERDLPPRPSG